MLRRVFSGTVLSKRARSSSSVCGALRRHTSFSSPTPVICATMKSWKLQHMFENDISLRQKLSTIPNKDNFTSNNDTCHACISNTSTAHFKLFIPERVYNFREGTSWQLFGCAFLAHHRYFFKIFISQVVYNVHVSIKCVRSRDQKPYLHNETKGWICIKIEFNPQKNISLLQHCRRFFVYFANMAAVTSFEHTLYRYSQTLGCAWIL